MQGAAGSRFRTLPCIIMYHYAHSARRARSVIIPSPFRGPRPAGGAQVCCRERCISAQRAGIAPGTPVRLTMAFISHAAAASSVWRAQQVLYWHVHAPGGVGRGRDCRPGGTHE